MTTQGGDGAGPRIGAVVCTYTTARLEQMAEAVASLGRQSRPPDRLLVVVDGDDELTEQVRSRLSAVAIERPAGIPVEVVGLGHNQGVGAARNRGVELLDTELIAFLDDDAVAEADWIECLAAPMVRSDVIGVGGGSLPLFEGPRPAWMPDEYLWTVGCSFAGMPQHQRPTRNFYGGCSIVRRDAFEAVGGFSSAFGHHGDRVGSGEEAEFCLRALAAHPGSQFLFDPRARIWHRVPTERAELGYFVRRCWIEGRTKVAMRGDRSDALGPEREFARALPGAVLRHLRGGRLARVAGIVMGTLAVLGGMLLGSVESVLRRRR